MHDSLTQIKVRGYHVDLYGHVNNARYLELLEEARWRHVEDQIDWEEFQRNSWGFVIVNINISYRKPAMVGDELHIRTEPKHLGGRSMVLRQTAYLNGTEVIAAEADVTFVIVDLKTQKVVPLEGRLKEVFGGD